MDQLLGVTKNPRFLELQDLARYEYELELLEQFAKMESVNSSIPRPQVQFEPWQLVRVEVRVDVPENAFFLAVEDYLPGGLEALNEGLSAANQVSVDDWGYESYQPFYWQDYGYNYKEIRGDRVVFFISTFEKGARTFTYYARVTTPGQFVALPAQAYAMYDSSLWGRSESTDVEINK